MHGVYSKSKSRSFQTGPFPNSTFMKPTSKQPKAYFTTPMKKILGYLMLLLLIGYCIFYTASGMKPKDLDYEVVIDNSGNIGQNIKDVPSSVPQAEALSDEKMDQEPNPNDPKKEKILIQL